MKFSSSLMAPLSLAMDGEGRESREQQEEEQAIRKLSGKEARDREGTGDGSNATRRIEQTERSR
jgi:hypothetical protein